MGKHDRINGPRYARYVRARQFGVLVEVDVEPYFPAGLGDSHPRGTGTAPLRIFAEQRAVQIERAGLHLRPGDGSLRIFLQAHLKAVFRRGRGFSRGFGDVLADGGGFRLGVKAVFRRFRRPLHVFQRGRNVRNGINFIERKQIFNPKLIWRAVGQGNRVGLQVARNSLNHGVDVLPLWVASQQRDAPAQVLPRLRFSQRDKGNRAVPGQFLHGFPYRFGNVPIGHSFRRFRRFPFFRAVGGLFPVVDAVNGVARVGAVHGDQIHREFFPEAGHALQGPHILEFLPPLGRGAFRDGKTLLDGGVAPLRADGFGMNLPVRQFIACGGGVVASRLVFLRSVPGLPGDGRILVIDGDCSYIFHPREMMFPETVDHVVLVNPGPRHFHALVRQAAGPGALHRLRIFYRLPRRTVFGVVEVY